MTKAHPQKSQRYYYLTFDNGKVRVIDSKYTKSSALDAGNIRNGNFWLTKSGAMEMARVVRGMIKGNQYLLPNAMAKPVKKAKKSSVRLDYHK